MKTGTRTVVYVDGFNLYYGALKGTPYKWLDLNTLFSNVFPKNNIVAVRYFTAAINALPSDPDQPTRQQLFWRALRTLPGLSIIEGHYLCHPKRMPLVNPPANGSRFAQVFFTEEKGSDVNLASHLLLDGFQNAYDCAIIVSGDSDLATPIEMVRNHLGKSVGVLLPQITGQRNPRRSARLRATATFFRDSIRRGVLQSSQFAPTLTDAQGTFRKPTAW